MKTSDWDIIIIGGGITGAGIFREASMARFKTLLVEQNDFAWGTSSRSSKMVHGGLRYLKEGRILLTRDSVVERERLLLEGRGLVEPLPFMMPVYKNHGPGKQTLKLGLSLYDMIAGRKTHSFFNATDFSASVPGIQKKGLVGGYRFYDAQVDDARLVQRLINESQNDCCMALNYTKAMTLLRNAEERVTGVVICDADSGVEQKMNAKVVINATGTFAERFQKSPIPGQHLRPLRGSHLVLPSHLLPVTETISFVHPKDHRPIFITPWEGILLLGTTDVDHRSELSQEPKISVEEVHYLLEGLKTFFPEIEIRPKDCLASLAGVRPVLSKGHKDPSKESREHVVWEDNGLITVTGGKLTTFRRLAVDTLKAAVPYIGAARYSSETQAVFRPQHQKTPDQCILSPEKWRRLYGRHGHLAYEMLHEASLQELEEIPGTKMIWAEFRNAARHEKIRHLSDLLLRRVRIGLLVKEGGLSLMPKIRRICEPELNWGAQKWETEIETYRNLWHAYYKVPDTSIKGNE